MLDRSRVLGGKSCKQIGILFGCMLASCKGFTDAVQEVLISFRLVCHGVNPVSCLCGGQMANEHVTNCFIGKAKAVITVVSSGLIDVDESCFKSFNKRQNATWLTKNIWSLQDVLLPQNEHFHISIIAKFEDEIVPHGDAITSELVLLHQLFSMFVKGTFQSSI